MDPLLAMTGGKLIPGDPQATLAYASCSACSDAGHAASCWWPMSCQLLSEDAGTILQVLLLRTIVLPVAWPTECA